MRTKTFASGTVMKSRAFGRDIVTFIRFKTPSGALDEGKTSSAVVVSFTARRNCDTSLLRRTPRKSFLASAFSSLAIMVRRQRTIGWNIIALAR